MATFEGTVEEFYKFLGARTSDLVTKYARPKRKDQKSCKRLNGKKPCGKYTRLDAAHLCGRERKVLIAEILEDSADKISKGRYKIKLELFEKKFEEKHKDFFNVIEFMCRKHHKAYDAENKKKNNCNPDKYDYKEFPEDNVEIEDLEKIDIKRLKSVLIERINLKIINKDNCSISRISFNKDKGFWNINIPKEKVKSDYYLFCYNQFNKSIILLKIKASYLKDVKPKKDEKSISISIPFSESEFIVDKTDNKLELINIYNISEI